MILIAVAPCHKATNNSIQVTNSALHKLGCIHTISRAVGSIKIKTVQLCTTKSIVREFSTIMNRFELINRHWESTGSQWKRRRHPNQ